MSDAAQPTTEATTPAAPATEAAPADAAGQAAAPAAPEKAPAAAQAPTHDEPPRIRARRQLMEARRAAAEKAAAPAPASEATPAAEAQPDAATKPNRAGEPQPITPDGKYAPKAEGAPTGREAQPAGEATGQTPAADAQRDTTATDAPAREPAEGYVHIALPDGHPLRDQGREYIVARKDQEEAVRAALNNPVRRRDLEAAERRIADLSRQLVRARAEAAVFQDPAADPLADEKTRETYQDILETYGEEHAKAYLRGLDQRAEKLKAKEQELGREAALQQAGEQFGRDLLPRAAQLFGVWAGHGEHALRSRLEPYVRQYAAAVDAGQIERPGVDDFLDRMLEPYARDPQVQAAVRAAAEQRRSRERETLAEEARRKADEAARAREEARRREAAERAQTKHPLGRVASEVRTDRQATTGEQPYDPTGKSPDQIKRERRAAVLGGRR